MFSIAAINDTDSKSHWEPLAPTKEAQEFHLSQSYHEGLLKLQAKEYAKAREHLEAVLKDPLISTAKVDNSAGDGHLLQLRFLALKNLANVFLQQGSVHYENALNCYLQAVEIDSKDSVVWNQLGTLSCSMGLYSISRWAFEQGLYCSPNNWNCMEKLLEVLIAIRDEIACLSVAELILRHWPSHSRALHVKSTIQEMDPVPFSPRGIDKLEPKHVRLKFPQKRKRTDSTPEEGSASKRLAKDIEVHLIEASWEALADSILGILVPMNRTSLESQTEVSQEILVNGKVCSEQSRDLESDAYAQGGRRSLQTPESVSYSKNLDRRGDTRLSIHFLSNSERRIGSAQGKKQIFIPTGETVPTNEHRTQKTSNVKEKEGCSLEEHHQERRSTRLERLRSRKPGKEELDFAASKDLAKFAVQVLEPFVVGRSGTQKVVQAVSDEPCPDVLRNLSNTEHDGVMRFVTDASKNYGAYHVAHLLLEDVAHRSLPYQEVFIKFVELEKLTRHGGWNRTIDCCLFLAELYFDFGFCSADESRKSVSLSEASYHLCKVIEMVTLESPADWNGVLNLNKDSKMATDMSPLVASERQLKCMPGTEIPSSSNISLNTDALVTAEDSVSSDLLLSNSLLSTKTSFWVRFFWLSGSLSILSGDKVKAYDEFCVSLVLLRNNKTADGLPSSVIRPHCKFTRELTADIILHKIHLLKVDFLLEKTISEMIEKEMYLDCVYMLAPLLLSTEEVCPNFLPGACNSGDVIVSAELSALDLLIKTCEKARPMDFEVYLKCHRRKLQLLLVAAGMVDHKTAMPKQEPTSEMETNEGIAQHWNNLAAEEVKEISRCASQVKNFIDQAGNSDVLRSSVSIVGDIQALLLTFMRNIISIYLCKKSSGLATADQTEQMESFSFLDAVIAFCKLQHLNQSVPVKIQVEFIVAVHDLLAEYGLCCSGKDSQGEEGTFLKLAIKHLLVLDMKTKSGLVEKDASDDKVSVCESNLRSLLVEESSLVEKEKTLAVNKDSLENPSGGIPPDALMKDNGVEDGTHSNDGNADQIKQEKETNQDVEYDDQLSDDEEKDELGIDNALDQCFFCLYGLNLRSSDSFSEDDLAVHKNTSRGEYQTKEQCADVFQYLLPYAKASSRTGLVKLRRVLRAIRKHFQQPPENLLRENSVDNFLDNPDFCEDKISEEAGSDGILEHIMSIIFPNGSSIKHRSALAVESSEPYLEVYGDLYYFLAQAEETSATDKWPGFVLTKEGEEFVEQNANLFKYDLLYNPLRFESWQQLANIYDEEVDLLLNDGSKHINVVGWRKNPSLPQRVETSRRRSRRCLLMSLALAKTPAQRSEMHELLALVYYDAIQNVVPIYDQRSVIPTKDSLWKTFCQNSMKHFEKAFAHKPDWSHAFYLGKLCEKLGYPHEKALSYYAKAITLNPSAVDPVYRIHASRLKLLFTCGKHNVEALKVIASYSFDQSTNVAVTDIINAIGSVIPDSPIDVNKAILETDSEDTQEDDFRHLEEAWDILHSDCISALKVCVEGELKHFHKARYMLAEGWYKKGANESLEKAKDELSFCFKSSRSSFTINMWEIESTVRKGRRKAPGVAGNKKVLEVNLAESSRKFITCIRKYILFYLKLVLESGDICMLDRAYTTLRTDKRFSLCLEDLVPVALARLIQGLLSSVSQAETLNQTLPHHLLERMFNLFIEQGNLWADISNVSEIKSPEFSESNFYRYLHQYIHSLQRDLRLESLEGINEKLRKRFKNPKLSNNNISKVCKHASLAWCRTLLISLASVTPLSSTTQVSSPELLYATLQPNELWNSSFEDTNHLKELETKWSALLFKINGVVIKQALEENMERANMLLKSCYNFYKESSCGTLPSCIILYTVPSTELLSQPGASGVEIIDLSIPRKLLLWAYTLVHGRYTNILTVVKHCEEFAKSKIKKGTPVSYASSHANAPTPTATQTGCGKERVAHNESGEAETNPSTMVVCETDDGGENGRS